MCLIETHLIGNADINLKGYTWFGQNRVLKHVSAKRGSGGIGFLVKDSLFDDFMVTVTDKSVEGIMSIEMKHKQSEFIISVIGVYLPPENSTYGRDSSSYFAQLISLIYAAVNSDLTLVCGDFNARVGKKLDYIPDIDDVPVRKVLDEKVNNHGEAMLEFLKDTKLCVVNGRVTSESDNFTYISTRGKSVVTMS